MTTYKYITVLVLLLICVICCSTGRTIEFEKKSSFLSSSENDENIQIDKMRYLNETQPNCDKKESTNLSDNTPGKIIIYVVCVICSVAFFTSIIIAIILSCKAQFQKNKTGKIDPFSDFLSQSLKYNECINVYKHTDCSICLEAFVIDCNVYKIKCGHLFHTKCLDEFNKISRDNDKIKQNRCPLCKIII